MEYLLQLEGITKAFNGIKALDDVSLRIRPAQVHALMGENGAGKSTLMKIINGMQPADSGKTYFKGKEVRFTTTAESIDAGISMIHQELNPVSVLTIMENIYLGREPKTKIGWVDYKKLYSQTKELLDYLQVDLDPHAVMSTLTVSEKQVVEIAKAISYDAELVIMDEPTSAITDKEIANLFRIINKLKADGTSIIYISHKMDEIFKIADEVTVFRDGKNAGNGMACDLDHDKLVEMMVGRKLTNVFDKEEAEIGEVVLSVKNLYRKGLFEDVSFDVRKGEILGLTGLMGAGRSEVCECIAGIAKADSGEIYKDGKKINIKSPKDAIANGIGMATEDRKRDGIFQGLSVTENITMSTLGVLSKGPFANDACYEHEASIKKEQLKIKTESLEKLCRYLSGGNQQKVVLAKLLLQNPDVLIVDEPTRGIDIGAKSEIHKILSSLAKEGKAIIMVSSEMPEIMGMSDRIIVMCEGEVTGVVNREENATQEQLFALSSVRREK